MIPRTSENTNKRHTERGAGLKVVLVLRIVIHSTHATNRIQQKTSNAVKQQSTPQSGLQRVLKKFLAICTICGFIKATATLHNSPLTCLNHEPIPRQSTTM